MNLKFFLEFENVQGDTCVVNFLYADYEGDPIRIFGGARPFVLSEFNTDNDLFKPVRPQQATIEVLASAAGVRMEDFIADNDEDVLIRFDFGEFTGYWYGYLSQEDIQETWIAQNHILTLRADDGFGRLKTIPLSDDGARLVGTFTPFQLIQYAMQTPVVTFLKSRVISNLYHTSMSSASNTTGIEQCTIDARTFETAPNEFEDSYTVLEKINRAWSSTLFQWNGDWFVLRMEEMFTDGNLIGFRQNVPVVGQRTGINQRYDIEVGVMKDVKPVVPEMIKTLQKPSKQTTIRFDYEPFDQVICNESFEDGTFLGTGSTTLFGQTIEFDEYSVNLWTHEKGNIFSPTAPSGAFSRLRLFVNFEFKDDYISIDAEPANADSWIKSCTSYLVAGDTMRITFQHAWSSNISGSYSDQVAVVIFNGDNGTQYSLDGNGQWEPVVGGAYFFIGYNGNNDGANWLSIDVTSEEAPTSGNFNLYLWREGPVGGAVRDKRFKDLKVEIKPLLISTRRRNIAGDYDRYTIQKELSKNYDETIFLDDFESKYYKGAITESDGITLTNDEWYRRRYSAERYTFKRQHAIARWFMNRSYKTKIDVNLYGLKWDISSTDYPIGIMNTLKFVDDAPTKIYAITNLKEVDFMSCIWSASLVEVYDTTVDQDVPADTDVHTFDFYYE